MSKSITQKCKIENCEGLGHLNKNGKRYLERGYCRRHYLKFNKYGDAGYAGFNKNDGRSNHYLYKTYQSIKKRCLNKTAHAYERYGGRGITVCDRWLGPGGFSNFIKDMGERPEGHSLDRIDNNKGYSPDNCRWATRHQQAANMRNNNEIVGVRYVESKRRWSGQLTINGKVYYKSFPNKIDAISYRKMLLKKHNIR